MELTNDFHVPAPVEKAWAILTNVELIAPCMPGAQLEEVEGEEYRGSVKIKVGPITAQYKGKATFLERDAENHVAKLKGEGRDSKGQGNASVTVTMTLKPGSNGGTDVTVHNDLSISGKVAQFARASVVKEISEKLLGQFVECLHHKLDEVEDVAADIAAASAAAAPAAAVSDAEATAPAASTPAPDASAEQAKPTVRKIEYKEAQPVDLLETAGTPIVKRVAPIAALVFLLVWLLRRSKK
jgi:carbon monoxide dehydrogenase subunit G